MNILGVAKYLGDPFGVAIVIGFLFDRIVRSDTKVLIITTLRDADYHKVLGSVPAIVKAIFTGALGERHFSLRCLIGSGLLSTASLLFVATFAIRHPSEFVGWHTFWPTTPGIAVFDMAGHRADLDPRAMTLLWLFILALCDYFSLLKTRYVIKLADWNILRHFIILIATLDTGITYILMIVGYIAFIEIYPHLLYGGSLYPVSILDELDILVYNTILQTLDSLPEMIAHPLAKQSTIFKWSGMLTALWLWVYVLINLATGLIASVGSKGLFRLMALVFKPELIFTSFTVVAYITGYACYHLLEILL